MARHGITYDDVISAANTLKGQGRSVTIENVRAFLGTGSAGTINQHLRRWKEAQNTTQKIASKENLPEGLIALVKGLWEGVLTESTEQFTPIESNYQQEIAELKAELEKYRNNNQRWQQLFNQWQQEKSKLAKELLTNEQALEFAHKENQSLHGKYEGLLQQVNEKKERIEELQKLHQQTQANLEHYRESVREQRLLDQQQFEQDKQKYLLDIKQLTEELRFRQAHLSELQRDLQISQGINERLEISNREALSNLGQLSETLKKSEKTKLSYEKDNALLDSQLKEKFKQITKFQSEAEWFRQQLLETKAQIDDLKTQNKLLTNDKWKLGQEKAQLEGQLKQLYKEVQE